MLPKALSQKLRQFPALYQYLVSIFLTLRRFAYLVSTFPEPAGFSYLDAFSQRRRLEVSIKKLEFTKSSSLSNFELSIREAELEDDQFFEQLTNASHRLIPLSFSWPGSQLPEAPKWAERKRNFSNIFPGKAYSYNSYIEYLGEYATAKYAITFKKGGWDCFRHIEIMSTGALPIMPDIKQCPTWAMAHYPKKLIALATDLVMSGNHVPEVLHSAIQKRFRSRLSSTAVASFLLKRIGYSGNRIFFLDPGLSYFPDYLSSMTLAGFKRILGSEQVQAPFGAQPIYSDWPGDSSNFHGLGFGYTKILAPELRSTFELIPLEWNDLLGSIRPTDLLVVGDISRNRELAQDVSELGHADSLKVFIWGGDRAPNRKERTWLAHLQGHLALRETY